MIKVKTTDECAQTTFEGDSHLLLNELTVAVAALMQILIEDRDQRFLSAAGQREQVCFL